MVYCTNCGKETDAKKICPHCGVKMNKKHNFCQWFGTALDPKAKLCSSCGEPKKIGSFLGNVLRVFLFVILLICGLAFVGDAPLTALSVFLVGVLQLPFAHRAFIKATHHDLKMRKLFSVVVVPVMVVLVVVSINSGMKISNYETALEHWEDKAYAAAMNYFVKNPEYKDSQQYIDKFESDVLASLTQSPWCSGLEPCDYQTDMYTRWDYAFDADGGALRRAQLWEKHRNGTYSLKSYEDGTFSYSFLYDVNEETGVYEARILLDAPMASECVLLLGVSEDGTIVVNGLSGKMIVYDQTVTGLRDNVNKTVDQNFSRDTSLPELD